MVVRADGSGRAERVSAAMTEELPRELAINEVIAGNDRASRRRLDVRSVCLISQACWNSRGCWRVRFSGRDKSLGVTGIRCW